MADIYQRLRDEIDLQTKALDRKPEILIVGQPRVQGICLEHHENGFVLGNARAQALDVVPNEATGRPEVQVLNTPMNNISEKLFYIAEQRVYVSVEMPRKAIVEPTKGLVLPR